MVNSDEKNYIDGEHLMPFKEFVVKLGVDRRTLYRMIDSGLVPKPIKQGKLNYFFKSDLLNYFTRLKRQRYEQNSL